MSPTRSYFIAGTDTEIGKTYTTCALLHHARGTGARVLGMKPVAAGAEEVDGRPRNQDALALIRASSFAADYDLVNPVCLTEAVAPHIAAADEGRQIDAATILAARDSLAEHADLLLIEGVGGFRVPLQLAYDTADLAVDLAAPVILVVGLRLGCINHALHHRRNVNTNPIPFNIRNNRIIWHTECQITINLYFFTTIRRFYMLIHRISKIAI